MAYPVSVASSGTQGDALEYELAQAGFSVQILDQVSVVCLTPLNRCVLSCCFHTHGESGVPQEMVAMPNCETHVVKSSLQATACFGCIR